MKILINLGKPCYTHVLRHFGMLFGSEQKWLEGNFTKENVVRWFNNVAPTLYEIVEVNDTDLKQGAREFVSKHLQITSDDVFLGDEEVKNKMSNWNEWGGVGKEAVLIQITPKATTVTII